MLRRHDSLGLGDQLTREWRRAGINFRVMLVGESGLGKTTFTRALLRPYVPEHLLDRGQLAEGLGEPVRARTVGIQEITHPVENDGFPVEFEIIDCPGYGDSVDSTGWIDNIVDYITRRFSAHYEALGSPPRQDGEHTSMNALQRDGLVHVCLYFIAAHRLKGVDLEFMRRLEPYVNLVPVIAKSDTMTLAERDAFRRLIIAELRANSVRIFNLSDDSIEKMPSSKPQASTPTSAGANGGGTGKNGSMATADLGSATSEALGLPPSHAAPAPKPAGTPSAATNTRALATTQPPPFAVCASEDGTRVYPWGTCCAEDPTHSDLSTLRTMLFASSMVDAKRTTLQLYESSYAKGRRQNEALQAERQAAALQRQLFVGKLAVLAVATTSVGIAAAGAVAVLNPQLAEAAASRIRPAIERLKNPRSLAGALLAVAERAIQRAQSHTVAA